MANAGRDERLSGPLLPFPGVILGEVTHLHVVVSPPCLPLFTCLRYLRLRTTVEKIEDPLKAVHVRSLGAMKQKQELGI